MVLGMNLTTLTLVEMKNLAKLLEAREELQARLAKIDAQLERFGGLVSSQAPAAQPDAKPGRKAATSRRSGRRGSTKSAVIDALKSAGKGGATVKAIAAKLGFSTQRIHVWFGSTGKNVKEIKKLGRGMYAWVG